MRLLYRIELVSAAGQRSVKDDEYSLPLTVGRGGSSQLLIPNASFPVEAFRIELEGSRLVLVPLNPNTVLQRNKVVVKERTALASGDEISWAGVNFALSQTDQNWMLSEYRVEGATAASDQVLSARARKLELPNRLPPMSVLCFVLSFFVAVCFYVFPLLNFGPSRESWSSGPLANKHAMVAGKCQSCHQAPFVQVQDKACLSCHNMSEHAPELSRVLELHPARSLRCAQCHMDHNGDHGLLVHDSKQCTQCHADLKQIVPESKHPGVPSFDKHPQFAVSLVKFLSDSEKSAQISRVSLDDTAHLLDPTHLKLNHKLHLKPDLRGPNGRMTLYCKDCHALSDNFATLMPITFEKNCRSCHTLEFDERLPGNQVPHGKPDVVYNYLYAEYAKLLLASQQEREQTGVSGFERFRPGSKPEPEQRQEYVKKYVEAEARVAERLLFARTACQLCHDISERTDRDQVVSTGEISNYQVLEPKVPDRWMPASTFSHGAHEEAKCESCHTEVRESERTSDVLLPGVDNCRSCHAETKHDNKIASDCSTCHSYHDSRELSPENKREIRDILSSVSR